MQQYKLEVYLKWKSVGKTCCCWNLVSRLWLSWNCKIFSRDLCSCRSGLGAGSLPLLYGFYRFGPRRGKLGRGLWKDRFLPELCLVVARGKTSALSFSNKFVLFLRFLLCWMLCILFSVLSKDLPSSFGILFLWTLSCSQLSQSVLFLTSFAAAVCHRKAFLTTKRNLIWLFDH